MVLPLVPLFAAAAGGLATGWAQSAYLGKKNTNNKPVSGDTIHHPYSTYQPHHELQYTHNPVITYPTYQTMVDSPLGRQTSKKEISSESYPTQVSEPSWSTPSQVAAAPSAGSDMMPLALIAVVGVLGYGMINKKGGKK